MLAWCKWASQEQTETPKQYVRQRWTSRSHPLSAPHRMASDPGALRWTPLVKFERLPSPLGNLSLRSSSPCEESHRKGNADGSNCSTLAPPVGADWHNALSPYERVRRPSGGFGRVSSYRGGGRFMVGAAPTLRSRAFFSALTAHGTREVLEPRLPPSTYTLPSSQLSPFALRLNPRS